MCKKIKVWLGVVGGALLAVIGFVVGCRNRNGRKGTVGRDNSGVAGDSGYREELGRQADDARNRARQRSEGVGDSIREARDLAADSRKQLEDLLGKLEKVGKD